MKCNTCSKKADVKDNNIPFCARCWIKICYPRFKKEQQYKHSRNK